MPMERLRPESGGSRFAHLSANGRMCAWTIVRRDGPDHLGFLLHGPNHLGTQVHRRPRPPQHSLHVYVTRCVLTVQ